MQLYKFLFVSSARAVAAVAVMVPLPAVALCATSPDMNGVWKSNDRGTYYVRQIGNEIWWLGMSNDGGRAWTNVYHGTKDGNVVTGRWADMPSGRTRSGGVLNLRVRGGPKSVSTFERTKMSGGFGGARWSKPCKDVQLNPVNED